MKTEKQIKAKIREIDAAMNEAKHIKDNLEKKIYLLYKRSLMKTLAWVLED
jgi:hypothetical protein